MKRQQEGDEACKLLRHTMEQDALDEEIPGARSKIAEHDKYLEKVAMARVVKDAVEAFGASCYPTTSYHSASNPVERFLLTLEQIIRVKLIDQGWPKRGMAKMPT
jgi:hypothetical protein